MHGGRGACGGACGGCGAGRYFVTMVAGFDGAAAEAVTTVFALFLFHFFFVNDLQCVCSFSFD